MYVNRSVEDLTMTLKFMEKCSIEFSTVFHVLNYGSL